MGSIGWLDEQRGIALWKFAEDDTMVTLMDDFRLFCEMLDSVDQPTYSVIDALDFKSIPRDMMRYYPEMARLSPRADRRSVLIAVVTRRMLVSLSVETFSRIYPDYKDRFVICPTMDQAVDHVEEHIRRHAA